MGFATLDCDGMAMVICLGHSHMPYLLMGTGSYAMAMIICLGHTHKPQGTAMAMATGVGQATQGRPKISNISARVCEACGPPGVP